MGYKCDCDASGIYINQEMRDGRFHVAYICSHCGEKKEKGKPFYGKDEVKEMGINIESLPLRSYKHKGTECAVIGCKNIGYQVHHWLPRHLSKEWHFWPVGKLCTDHHQMWHKLTKTGIYRSRNDANKLAKKAT